MNYEEFEDRRGASTTGDRRAVWDAAFEEGTRHAWEALAQLEAELAKHKEARALAEALVISHEGRIGKLDKELTECRERYHDLGSAKGRMRMDDLLTCAVHGEQEEWLCVCHLCQNQLEDELAECLREIEAAIESEFRIQQILGMALYGKGEDGSPLWGEHTAETLAMEAARKLGQNPPEKRTPDPPLKEDEQPFTSTAAETP